jgi:uncharacterized protein YuzE
VSLLRVTFSPDVEAFYLTVTDREVAETVDVTDLIAVDLDVDGEVVGVEFVMRPEALTEAMYRELADRYPVLSRANNERAAVAERVIAAMRAPQGRDPMAEDAHGIIEVAIGLRSDTISDAAGWVAALGGRATVIVPRSRTGIAPLVWTMTDDLDTPLVPSYSDVHPDSDLGMLVDYLDASGAASREGGFSFRITVGDSEAEITESGPLLALA